MTAEAQADPSCFITDHLPVMAMIPLDDSKDSLIDDEKATHAVAAKRELRIISSNVLAPVTEGASRTSGYNVDENKECQAARAQRVIAAEMQMIKKQQPDLLLLQEGFICMDEKLRANFVKDLAAEGYSLIEDTELNNSSTYTIYNTRQLEHVQSTRIGKRDKANPLSKAVEQKALISEFKVKDTGQSVVVNNVHFGHEELPTKAGTAITDSLNILRDSRTLVITAGDFNNRYKPLKKRYLPNNVVPPAFRGGRQGTDWTDGFFYRFSDAASKKPYQPDMVTLDPYTGDVAADVAPEDKMNEVELQELQEFRPFLDIAEGSQVSVPEYLNEIIALGGLTFSACNAFGEQGLGIYLERHNDDQLVLITYLEHQRRKGQISCSQKTDHNHLGQPTEFFGFPEDALNCLSVVQVATNAGFPTHAKEFFLLNAAIVTLDQANTSEKIIFDKFSRLRLKLNEELNKPDISELHRTYIQELIKSAAHTIAIYKSDKQNTAKLDTIDLFEAKARQSQSGWRITGKMIEDIIGTLELAVLGGLRPWFTNNKLFTTSVVLLAVALGFAFPPSALLAFIPIIAVAVSSNLRRWVGKHPIAASLGMLAMALTIIVPPLAVLAGAGKLSTVPAFLNFIKDIATSTGNITLLGEASAAYATLMATIYTGAGVLIGLLSKLKDCCLNRFGRPARSSSQPDELPRSASMMKVIQSSTETSAAVNPALAKQDSPSTPTAGSGAGMGLDTSTAGSGTVTFGLQHARREQARDATASSKGSLAAASVTIGVDDSTDLRAPLLSPPVS